MQACEFVGLPECQLTLSQAVTYLACAPVRADLPLPRTVAVHLVKPPGQVQAQVVPDRAPNSWTDIELLARRRSPESPTGELGLYRLVPHTGRTHQLRAHLAWLGIPIWADPLYPWVQEVADDDFTTPLGLVAARVRFTDPFDGSLRDLSSPRAPFPW